MAKIRAERVGEQMKKEIAEIIRLDLKDTRIGFATITHVDMTGDLQHAKVFVSVFGSDEEKKATLDALTRANGFIRGEVSRRLRLRLAPEISFKLDESGQYSQRIETVLRTLHAADDTRSASE